TPPPATPSPAGCAPGTTVGLQPGITVMLQNGAMITAGPDVPPGTLLVCTAADSFVVPLGVTILGAQCRPNADGQTQTCTVTPGARITVMAAQRTTAATPAPVSAQPPAAVAAAQVQPAVLPRAGTGMEADAS